MILIVWCGRNGENLNEILMEIDLYSDDILNSFDDGGDIFIFGHCRSCSWCRSQFQVNDIVSGKVRNDTFGSQSNSGSRIGQIMSVFEQLEGSTRESMEISLADVRTRTLYRLTREDSWSTSFDIHQCLHRSIHISIDSTSAWCQHSAIH